MERGLNMERLQEIKDEICRRIIALNDEIAVIQVDLHPDHPYLVGMRCRRAGLQESLELLREPKP